MRPVRFPDSSVILPPRLCGGIGMYVQAWAVGSSAMDWTRHFDKREKEAHRFTIADTRGPLQLTVPIVKPHTSRVRWDEIEVSTHGAWWDVHRVALESAYGRTPYFEFYEDRLLPMLTAGVTDRYPLLSSLARKWDEEIRSMLGLPKEEYVGSRRDAPWCIRQSEHFVNDRHSAADAPGCIPTEGLSHALPPYRQVRESKLGFIPGLSVLDLIFNLGPEAQIYLNRLASALT